MLAPMPSPIDLLPASRMMRPGGRLIFPLAPAGVLGGMLLVKRPDHGAVWPARFRGRAQFIGCIGLQDEEAGRRLTEAFTLGWERVRSLRLDSAIDDTCWFAGDDNGRSRACERELDLPHHAGLAQIAFQRVAIPFR